MFVVQYSSSTYEEKGSAFARDVIIFNNKWKSIKKLRFIRFASEIIYVFEYITSFSIVGRQISSATVDNTKREVTIYCAYCHTSEKQQIRPVI
jgi:hypothetical protein